MTIMRAFRLSAFTGLLAVSAAALPAFAQQGKCSNPEINAAYATAMHRAPNGTGKAGECNESLYGHWENMKDLEAHVVAYNSKGSAPASSGLAVPAQYTFFIDPAKNLVANTPARTVLAPTGTWVLQNPDGTAVAIVASGGGNIVASGGGNIVASGGGNYNLQSTGGKKIFIVKK